MTSELLLLFLFLGYIALRNSFSETAKADRVSAVLAVVGVINVPIIHYSVKWWNTLHQPASVMKLGTASIDGSMLWALLIMALGFNLFFGYVLMRRTQAEVLLRERRAGWVAGLAE